MRPWKEYGRYGSVGIEMVLSMMIGLWVGTKADNRLHTAPWLAIVGFVIGAYAGFRALFATAKKMEADIARAEAAEEKRARKDAWDDPTVRRRDIEKLAEHAGVDAAESGAPGGKDPDDEGKGP